MKILIISYWFLPASMANAKRPFYLAEAFLKEGWAVDVVASYSGMTPAQKEILSHPNLNIQRIEDPADVFCRKLKEPFKTLVFRCFKSVLWPDLYVAWALRILFRVKPEEYDRVILCLHPASLLLSLFKKVSDRWIIDCQEVFYPVFVEKRRSPIPWILSPLLIKVQRHVFKKSGCVLFTSESGRKEYIRRKLVEADKTVHIPLFFDEKAFKNTSARGSQFNIAYFGMFGCRNGVRSPESFLQALKRFLDRNPEARPQTTFQLFGRFEKESDVIERIDRLGLQDVVAIHTPVLYEQYLEALSSASVFLLLVASHHKLFIPSKMLDYFGARRPILGFVPFDSESYAMLKEANMTEYICDEEDVERGAENIGKLWSNWKKALLLCENAKTNRWSASFQTARVVELLNSTFKGNRKV